MTDSIRTGVLACLSLLAVAAGAQESAYRPREPLPVGSTLLSLPSPHVASAGEWEARFAHRFAEARGEGLHTLWGLDNGANVTMGAAYVPRRDLEVALLRSSVLETWEASLKYVVVQEAEAIPLSLSLRAGIDLRGESGIHDRTSPFVQAIVARRLGTRLELYALPTWAGKAGRATSGEESFALFDDAFNVPFGAALFLGGGLSAVAELTPANRDLLRGGDPGWSAGIKKAVGRHHFEVIVTNSAATTVDQIVSTTWLGEPLENGGIRIGFNIERQFGRARGAR